MEDITKKSDLSLFLKEIGARWSEGSPKFFRVMGWISLVMAGIGFIPDLLNFLQITLPEKWMAVLGRFMVGAGLWGKFVASMPVKQPTKEVMPFTEKKQIEQIEKAIAKNET